MEEASAGGGDGGEVGLWACIVVVEEDPVVGGGEVARHCCLCVGTIPGRYGFRKSAP